MNEMKAFFIIILFYPISLFSQNPGDPDFTKLVYGTNHEDVISELGEIDYYSFDGTAGDVIMLRMRDETKVDAYINLFDPEGEMVAFAWSDGGLANIRDFVLVKSGTYQIQAFDRNHNDVGKYGLSLHKLNGNNYSQDIPEITSFEDNINQLVGVNMYSLKAEKGDVLFTQMRSRTVHLECEFYIYNSSGVEIYKAENTGRLATVGPIEIEKSDTYTVVVSDRGGNDMDKFGLTHMLLNRHETVTNLSCGDNRTDQLTKLAQRNAFRLKTRPGQIPLVEARSNNILLETTMIIYDEKGEIVRKKSSTNKLISELIPASDIEKSYLIVVYDRNGNDFGDFGLQVQFLDNSFCPNELNCSNQEQIIHLDGLAQSRLFSIEGIAGEPINVIMKETEAILEPHLRVYNLSGEIVAESFHAVKAKLTNQVFPANGTYLILASDRSGNDLGAFELSAPAKGDLTIEITGCQTVFRGYTEALSFADAEVSASGSGIQYLWSSGETTASIHVCPLESTTFYVTVTNSSGCAIVAETFVEVIDVSCGNGNGEQKVEVCHVKDNGQHQTKCISVNGVDAHLNNGNGHVGCHLGPCDHSSPCDEEGQKENILTSSRSLDTKALIFPNPTASELSISLELIPSEEVSVTIFDVNGVKVMYNLLENNGQKKTYDLRRLGIAQGIYFVSLNAENYSETQQILFLK